MDDIEPTSPEDFAEIASKAAETYRAEVNLQDYMDSVHTLHDAGMPWRKIAALLSEHGIQCDHNTLWRVYHKWADTPDEEVEQDVRASEEADEQEDREAARRDGFPQP